MDKDWKWLPIHMPGVAKLVRERRKQDGDEHVNECWTRGVMKGEPGWFFAAEGPLTVGTPSEDERLRWLASLRITKTQALLEMKNKEASDGKG